MALRKNLGALSSALRTGRVRTVAGLAAAAVGIPLVLGPGAAHAATPTLIYGTLDTEPGTAATEAANGVGMAMFEFDWASYEPKQGTFSTSYMNSQLSLLHAYQAVGMKVTLELGLEDPPSWVRNLADGTFIDQKGNVAPGDDLVFSAADRAAAAAYLAKIASNMPLTDFWAIRLSSGNGDGEMLYPGSGTYYAFNPSALTGTGLPAGMASNPDPTWKPGTKGLTPAQITAWITWYIGGLDNVTNWEMTTLSGLGFKGYYETVTPGSGTRPDQLVTDENTNLPNDGTTGVGAVWQLYYANLPNKANVIAYISSVADDSGGNDLCTSTDDAQSLTSPALDSWSATRWITRIADQYGLLVGGENPGYGDPASLDSFYTNTTSTGMMATALAQARSCGFTVYYWAHDVHLWDGTIPFTTYASMIKA